MEALEIRKIGDSHWDVFHIPTGMPLGAPEINGRNKRKQVIEFMAGMLQAFPWERWTDVGSPPEWANEAYWLRNSFYRKYG